MPKTPAPGTPVVPLAVDFDGTMQLSDLNIEGMAWLWAYKPSVCLELCGVWMKRGKGAMKLAMQKWAEKKRWVPSLPMDKRVLRLMLEAKRNGREVVVVTGSAERLVRAILAKEGLKFPVIGTTSALTNLVRDNKAAELVLRYGERGFDYVGNSRDDLPVWMRARKAIVVNASAKVIATARMVADVEVVLPREVSRLEVWRGAWARRKNAS